MVSAHVISTSEHRSLKHLEMSQQKIIYAIYLDQRFVQTMFLFNNQKKKIYEYDTIESLCKALILRRFCFKQ